MFKGSKNAFTLAEVLITLGIIGVVAAMTMPTLLNSTQGAQYRTAFKKGLSVLSQAVVLNVALDDYDLSQTTSTETGTNDASIYNIFKNRTNVVATSGDAGVDGWGPTGATFGSAASSNYTLFFNDGMAVTFPQAASGCTRTDAGAYTTNCKGAIDVNGAKNPNVLVACDSGTSGSSCKVTSPTDIFPIVFYDQSVAPNSDAARAVMYKGK